MGYALGKNLITIPHGENNAAKEFSTKKGSPSSEDDGPESTAALLPVKELLVGLAVGKACPSHPDVLQQSQVLHLVPAALLVKQLGGLLVVGLNAADVIGLLEGQRQERVHKAGKERLSLFTTNLLRPRWGSKLIQFFLSIVSPCHAPSRESSTPHKGSKPDFLKAKLFLITARSFIFQGQTEWKWRSVSSEKNQKD